jgi:hypothetical protein
MQYTEHQSKFQQFSSKQGYDIARFISAYVRVVAFVVETKVTVKATVFD